MKKIESRHNPRIKSLQRVRDRKSPGLWIIEGKKLILEAIQSGVQLQELFITERFCVREAALMKDLQKSGAEIVIVTEAVMQNISEVATAPGVLAIARKLTAVSNDIPDGFAVFLFAIGDPGNFGTLIRAAEAANADFLAYSSNSVEPFHSKVVRASAGSIFRMPLLHVEDAESFLKRMRGAGVHIYGLYPQEGSDLFQIAPQLPAIVLIGSESHGLPESLPVQHRLAIPMAGRVESLNAAIAGAICFYRFFTATRAMNEDI